MTRTILITFLWISLTGTIHCQPPGKIHYPHMLFYIERNQNRNIIVYEAHFDEKGDLDSNAPVNIFWIMHEKNGKQQPLTFTEKKLAYGLVCHKTGIHEYRLHLVSYKNKIFRLRQTAPYRAEITTTINGYTVAVKHIFIEADNHALFPHIKYILLEGENIRTKKHLCEYFRPRSTDRL